MDRLAETTCTGMARTIPGQKGARAKGFSGTAGLFTDKGEQSMIRLGLRRRAAIFGDALGVLFFSALTLGSAAQLFITRSPLSFGLALYNALLVVTLALRDAPAKPGTR